MYWWISLIVIALYAVETVAVVLLRNNRKASLLLVFIAASVWLMYKIGEFSSYRAAHKGLYPVEFSHITYFIVGITMLTGVKKLRAFASYCGMLTGVGFLIASIASPASMVKDAASTFSLCISIFQHSLMWMCGFSLFFAIDRYNLKDIWISILGIACMVGFSFMVHYHVIYKDFVKWDDMVIIKIATGTILGYIVDPAALTIPIRVFTVIGIFIGVAATLVLFYWGNNKIYDRRAKRFEESGKEISSFEIGILPLIKYFVERNHERQGA